MSLAVGALALAFWVGAGSSAYAQDQQTTPTPSPGVGTPNQPNGAMNGADQGRRSRRRDRMRADNMSSSDTSSSSDSMRQSRIRWSERYRLSPIEHKRLRAMGLNDDEVFAVANAAHESGVDVDEIVQMVLRGRDYFQIAEQLGIPYDSLMHRRPEWQTAEWQQEVREGWFTHREGMSGSTAPASGGSSR
jgi:hypothetical protein